MLTDAQGRFSFVEFADAQTYASVSKPGYASTLAASDGPASIKFTDLTVPLELKLYPDAIIAGTVSGRDGSPLHGVGIQLYRAGFDANGFTSSQIGYTATDTHGSYRFQEPAGRYRIETRYLPSMEETGQAVLPVAFPSSTSSDISSFFQLAAGQERHVNLRPIAGKIESAELSVPGAAPTAGRDFGRDLRASVETSEGIPFSVELQNTATPGAYKLALPAGSYRVEITSGDREQPLYGSAHVTVSARETNVTQVNLLPSATYPVEIALDPAVAATTLPAANQLNLSLQRVDGSVNGSRNIPMRSLGNGYGFRAPAGRYRLVSPAVGTWSVRSASVGAADLLNGELAVGGSGGSPIRLVVTNATGQVNGTVQMGTAASGWLYLIAREPSLTPVLMERIGSLGNVSRNVPPGAYTVLAVENRIQADLHDRATAQAILAQGQQIDVAVNGKTTFSLSMLSGLGDKP